jgi:hypothetical protein
MTNSLSPSDPRGQQPDPAGQCDLPGILPFDLHAEGHPDEVGGTGGPDTLPLPGGPRGDDDADDFDPDDDTKVDADARGSEFDGYDDDDPPPANAGAVGLPCHSDASQGPKSPKYTLCVANMREDDPDEVQDGQDLIGLRSRSMAMACCDGFAMRPDMLAGRFGIDPSPYTHLVVNDDKGKELHRRPILAAA